MEKEPDRQTSATPSTPTALCLFHRSLLSLQSPFHSPVQHSGTATGTRSQTSLGSENSEGIGPGDFGSGHWSLTGARA